MPAMPAEHATHTIAEQAKSRVGGLLPPTHQASKQATNTQPDENSQSCY